MRPHNEAELAEIIAGTEVPLAICGGGTQGIEPVGLKVETTALQGIELYEPGALTIVVRTGTPLADVTAALAAQNQRLAFEPVDYRGLMGTGGTPTIGGVIASNSSGPRRIQSGAARDYMLGVRYVDGMGNVVKNGGRVMKNVTGYDLVKLLTGSFGTLGVMTQVALKVLPQTEIAASILLEGLSNEQAVLAMSDALGSPFEVTGAGHALNADGGMPLTMIRIEGFESSVAYRASKIQELLKPYGEARVETDPQDIARMWSAVRDVGLFYGKQGDVWRISCKPSNAPELIAGVVADDILFDWGGGLIWALTSPGTDLRAALGAFDGHARLVRSDPDTRKRLPMFPPQSAGIEEISAKLRKKFDPRQILNPGLMQTRSEA